MNRLKKKRKIIFLVGLVAVIIAFCFYYYLEEKKVYQKEVAKDFTGIITAKFRNQKNNPKSYRIRINDSIEYDIPFVLIDRVDIGDTVVKKKSNDFYMYYTKGGIIKVLIPIATIFGYPKDMRKPGEEIVR